MTRALVILAQLLSALLQQQGQPQRQQPTAAGVQFATRLAPDTVYAGQQVTYDAITLLDDATRMRLRANPEFTPADVAGATVYDFPFDTASVRDTVAAGARYRRYVYRRALFPLAPGTYTAGPATLRYSIPDGYGAAQQVVLESAAQSFVALPLPLAGRPVAFSGAVGELRDSLWTDGSAVRVGDTFVVTVRLAGVGNLNLLPRPTLQLDWGSVVAGPERVSWDSTGTVVRGSKEFDWVVTPRVAGTVPIGPVRYDYFNPATRRYEAATTAPVQVAVQAVGPAAPRASAPPRDSIGDSPFPVMLQMARRNALVVAVVAVVAVLLAFVGIARGRKRRGEDRLE